eukprot:TRINITY_DN3015_c0_g1_i3.p1 TRINITY_DN3015_c0_g1~~TRINITY_DN3015_c0_g1_i3.p1  ORF type:complete len:646 (+),score=165.72 TRINITY_DN3015_c0_g1_i3:603-2540(+)
MTVRDHQYIFMSEHFLCKTSDASYFPTNGTAYNETMNLKTNDLWIVTASNYLLVAGVGPSALDQRVYTDYGNCSLTMIPNSIFPNIDWMENICWWDKDSTLYFISADGNFTRCEYTLSITSDASLKLMGVSFSCSSRKAPRWIPRGASSCWTTEHWHYVFGGVSYPDVYSDIIRFQDQNGCELFEDDYLLCINGNVFYPGNWNPQTNQTVPIGGGVTVNGTIGINGTINIPINQTCGAGVIVGNGNVTGNGTIIIGLPGGNLGQTCNLTIINWNGTFNGNLSVGFTPPTDPSNCRRNTSVTGTRGSNGFTVTVTSTLECDGPPTVQSSSSTGTIIGATIGAIILLIAITTVLILILRYRGRSREDAIINNLELQKWTLDGVQLERKIEGAIYRGKWLGTEVACKNLRGDEAAESLNALKRLNHPNLVQYLGIFQDEVSDVTYLVMELAKGKLTEFLKLKKDQLDPIQLIELSIQACAALAYLTKEGILHEELTLENCLYNDGDDVNVKVSHFGTSSFPMGLGTVGKYPSPESLERGEISEKSLVFEMGFLLWRMWSYGDIPFDGDGDDVISRISRGDRPTRPMQCPDEMFEEGIESCWREMPHDRPTFQHLLEIWQRCRRSYVGLDSDSDEVQSLEADANGDIYV